MIIDEATEDQLFAAAIAELEALPIRISSDIAVMIAASAVAGGESATERLASIIAKWGERERAFHKAIQASIADQATRECRSEDRTAARREMTPSLRLAVLQRDGHKCVSCGATPADSKLHIDHKVAIANGGKTEIGNLQVLCADCNLAKGAKVIELPAIGHRK